MADINISVNSSEATITLDVWEWTGLSINGTPASRYSGPNPNIQFQESSSLQDGKAIHFTATANQYIDLVNPGTQIFMDGADNNSTYILIISYQEKNNVVTLKGSIIHLPYVIDNPQQSPQGFSQGRMTGTFQLS